MKQYMICVRGFFMGIVFSVLATTGAMGANEMAQENTFESTYDWKREAATEGRRLDDENLKKIDLSMVDDGINQEEMAQSDKKALNKKSSAKNLKKSKKELKKERKQSKKDEKKDKKKSKKKAKHTKNLVKKAIRIGSIFRNPFSIF